MHSSQSSLDNDDNNNDLGIDYQGDMNGGGAGYVGGSSSFGGGGYTTTTTSGSSQGGGGGRRRYDEQTLTPVTAFMLQSSQSSTQSEGTGNLALPDGRDLHYVKLVGAVRGVEEHSTNVSYQVEDGTGLVDVKQWLDDNDCSAVAEIRQDCLRDAIHVRVVGQLKDYDGKKTLVAHSVKRLQDCNELTYHFLEVVYTSERYKRGDRIVGMPPVSSHGVGFGGTPLQHRSNAAPGSNGDGVREQVLNFIKVEGDNDDYGASVQRCIQLLTANGKVTESQIRKTLDDLSAEGHIYSTVNDDHYKFAM